MEPVICPWCDTEIVWDEEIGPEEECPHCNNELKGYRTLQVQLDAVTEDDEQMGRYEETVEQVLDQQEEVPECMYCREYMVLAGKQATAPNAFQPNVPEAVGQPFVEAPFNVNMYVCTGCFQVAYVLSAEDRQKMINRLSR
ncbi:hypothetical protein [Paenibacillus terrigena]|uniref:hypothetical protein n=1 Tax=Paenibacillus terrigena TaxID=369333 RepID=UPI000370BC0D|nr:hypothetical protein [Paenibacillus terrigena]